MRTTVQATPESSRSNVGLRVCVRISLYMDCMAATGGAATSHECEQASVTVGASAVVCLMPPTPRERLLAAPRAATTQRNGS